MLAKRNVVAFLLFVLLCPAIACKRSMSHEEVENQLKMAMRKRLYEGIHNDSSTVKYDVQKVTFFEDKTVFQCEFTVRMTKPGYDTTGTMGATISKDFKMVGRKF